MASTRAGVHRGSKNFPENDFCFRKNAHNYGLEHFYAYISPIVFFIDFRKNQMVNTIYVFLFVFNIPDIEMY